MALQVDLEIGPVNKDGLRGTKAVRDMKKDQIAVLLPSHLTIPLGEGKVTPEVCHHSAQPSRMLNAAHCTVFMTICPASQRVAHHSHDHFCIQGTVKDEPHIICL